MVTTGAMVKVVGVLQLTQQVVILIGWKEIPENRHILYYRNHFCISELSLLLSQSLGKYHDYHSGQGHQCPLADKAGCHSHRLERNT